MKHNWEYKPVSEVFETVTDFVAAGSFADLRDNVIYNSEKDFAQLIRTTDLKNYFSNQQFVYVNEHAFNYLWRVNLSEECIILPNIGNCGEVYYLHPSMLVYPNNVLGPNAIMVRSKSHNQKYLAFALKGSNFQRQLSQIVSQVAQSKFNKTNLKKLLLPVPPMEVQEQIVAELDKINEVIEDCRELLRNLDALAKSLFYDYFGDPATNPKDFPIVPLSDIFSLITDGTHQTPTYTTDIENGVKFLSAKDVVNGFIDWTKIKYIPFDLHVELHKRLAPQRGDILLCKNGTTGICALVETDDIFDIYVSLALLRPEVNSCAKYLVYAINNPFTREQFNHSLKGIGVPNLHLNKIRGTKIILPPLELQEKFAERVEQIEAQKKAVEETIANLQTLLDSRMDYWFN